MAVLICGCSAEPTVETPDDAPPDAGGADASDPIVAADADADAPECTIAEECLKPEWDKHCVVPTCDGGVCGSYVKINSEADCPDGQICRADGLCHPK